MKSFSSLAAFAVLAATGVAYADRNLTVTNKCSYTVWPGLFTDPSSKAKPTQVTGWEAAPASSTSFAVPNGWTSGRIWGRRDCDFSKQAPNDCVTGGCNGGLQCDPSTGTGVPPATVAEFTLNGDGNADWYDVSVVDGFNVPVEITNTQGCSVASCPTDLNANCPSDIAGPSGPSGNEGCKSACEANLDGNPSDSANCCTGSHDKPATCPNSTVTHYDYFKKGCPNAYAYAYDESSGTALWQCDSGKNADYTVTFCPS
ncbi:hypothetical protein PLICRDRAFT_538201 [Plicaturopsis crispa FD-325 SS-3]|nr:hypothetical protein PLICRDRAFT_538201 [Plicaturopsis crispa FD-325 SS-3]